VEQPIIDLLAWLEPRALLLAVLLPPLIRVVGHWLPEELFMMAMGVLAARSETPGAAAGLLGAVFVSHLVVDQMPFQIGRWLRPRLARFPRIEHRLRAITTRLDGSPGALLAFIPARVLPLGRGAWMISCGVVGIRWRRYLAVDAAALCAHLLVWSGLGWWLAEDLSRLDAGADVWKAAGIWGTAALLGALGAVVLWRRRVVWQPVTARAVRLAGRSIRRLHPSDRH
jgi:membrane protein DedA with SNARE-associated domain